MRIRGARIRAAILGSAPQSRLEAGRRRVSAHGAVLAAGAGSTARRTTVGDLLQRRYVLVALGEAGLPRVGEGVMGNLPLRGSRPARAANRRSGTRTSGFCGLGCSDDIVRRLCSPFSGLGFSEGGRTVADGASPGLISALNRKMEIDDRNDGQNYQIRLVLVALLLQEPDEGRHEPKDYEVTSILFGFSSRFDISAQQFKRTAQKVHGRLSEPARLNSGVDKWSRRTTALS